MNTETKINMLDTRLHRLNTNGQENAGIRRKIQREIRKLKDKL